MSLSRRSTRSRGSSSTTIYWPCKRELGTTIVFVTHSVFESVFLSSRIAVMGPRPGRVVAEIAIDAPLARGNFRTSTAYAHYCAQASRALHGAMDADVT